MDKRERNRTAAEEDRRLQADPELGLSGGRAAASQILWVGVAVAVAVVLLIFGLTRGGEENVAGNPPQQTVPPPSAGANAARTPPAQDNVGASPDARTGTTQRSSDVDAVGGSSTRNPGSGKVAPPQ